MSASYFILWWRQTQERSSSVSKRSLLTTPQDPVVFVFPETALSSACNMGTGSRGRGRHRPTWTQTDLGKPWQLRNPRESSATDVTREPCMQASQHSPATEHIRRPGLTSLFEVVALTLCCRYKVRNCLLTRVRQGEALGTDLPEQ